MMIGNMIAESLRISLRYAESLADGISAADFGKMARVDGQLIDSNNPAWVYGHLSIYAPRIITELGCDAEEFQPDDQWNELFSPKSKCQDDPEGNLYPSKEVLVRRLLDSYQRAMEVLLQSDDSQFAAANANEAMRNRFETVGGMHAFYCGGHFMIHMGQVSAWRRMMGLGSAF
jgi:hypothetical protein